MRRFSGNSTPVKEANREWCNGIFGRCVRWGGSKVPELRADSRVRKVPGVAGEMDAKS